MTAGPSHLLMEPGHTARLPVTEIGTKPLAVTGSVVKVGEAARGASARTVAGVTASPEHMSIAPGHTGWATVTVAKGAPDQDVAAVFAASAGKGAGTARVSGAVGSQVVVGHVPGRHIPAPGRSARASRRRHRRGGRPGADRGAGAGRHRRGRPLAAQAPAVGVQLRRDQMTGKPMSWTLEDLERELDRLGARDARGHHRLRPALPAAHHRHSHTPGSSSALAGW